MGGPVNSGPISGRRAPFVPAESVDISGKVDKVPGKGLSENDYTDEDKALLYSLESGSSTSWNTTEW